MFSDLDKVEVLAVCSSGSVRGTSTLGWLALWVQTQSGAIKPILFPRGRHFAQSLLSTRVGSRNGFLSVSITCIAKYSFLLGPRTNQEFDVEYLFYIFKHTKCIWICFHEVCSNTSHFISYPKMIVSEYYVTSISFLHNQAKINLL